MQPLVSIGIPVYNGERFISNLIDSLLIQSYLNIELIISDNCSTDSTDLICQKYLDLDTRVKYYKQELNIGMFPNFNFVFKKANGTYFMWAAADDKWDPDFIMQAVDVLESNKDCVSVFSHFEIFDINTGNNLEKITPSSNASSIISIRIKKVIEELHPNLIYGLHRKNLISNIKFETVDWADILFISHLVTCGKYFIIPKVMYYIGINGTTRVPYSVTGKWLNLFPFSVKFFHLLRRNSANIFSFFKNYLFTLKIIILSTIKVNHDIYRSQ